MFRAFFDESRTDPEKNKALVMGGFLGRVEEWERASDAWDECLHEAPDIGYFKHSEAQSLNGEFLKFNRASADKKVLALANVISQFKLLGMCISVLYRHFAGKDARVTKGMIGTRAYDWGFSGTVNGVLSHMQKTEPPAEKVDFVFDDRNELRANIDIFYKIKGDDFFKEMMSRAGDCMPGDDKQVVALQMADLLAWEFSQAGETRTMSEAFKVIREKNRVGHLRCQPPPQMNPSIRLLALGNEVRSEAIELLKQTKKPRENLSAEEMAAQLGELLMRESYFNVELGRLMQQLADDPEFQDFMKGYLKGKDAL